MASGVTYRGRKHKAGGLVQDAQEKPTASALKSSNCEPEPEVVESKQTSGSVDCLCSEVVSTLLKNCSAAIDELRTRLQDALPAVGENGLAKLEDGMIIDDLWLLRYVLSSKGDLDLGESRARETLEWREKHKASLIEVRQGRKLPLEDRVQTHLLSAITGVLNGNEPVNVTRLGLSDCKALMNSASVEDVALFLAFEKEKMYELCDAATRETGRLVKAVTVMDFRSFSMMSSRFDKRILSAIGASSKQSSVLFPQLQAKTIVVNTPSMFGMVQKALGAVMPKSSMEKMMMCPVKNTESSDISTCPFSILYGVPGAVPPFLGGTAAMPDELLSRDEREKKKRQEELERLAIETTKEDSYGAGIEAQLELQPFETMIIGPRSYAIAKVPVDAPNDSEVYFQIQVDQHSIDMSATLFPLDADSDSDESTPLNSPGPTSEEVDALPSKSRSRSKNFVKIPKRARRRSGPASDKKMSQAAAEAAAGTTFGQDTTMEFENLPMPIPHTRQRSCSDSSSLRSARQNTLESDERYERDDWRSVQVFSKRRLRKKSPKMPASPALHLQPTLVPMRIAAKEGLIKGQWAVHSAGVMWFRFDNTFSKLRSKRVRFRVIVVKKSEKADASASKGRRLSKRNISHYPGTPGQKLPVLSVVSQAAMIMGPLLLAFLVFSYFFPNASLTFSLGN